MSFSSDLGTHIVRFPISIVSGDGFTLALRCRQSYTSLIKCLPSTQDYLLTATEKFCGGDRKLRWSGRCGNVGLILDHKFKSKASERTKEKQEDRQLIQVQCDWIRNAEDTNSSLPCPPACGLTGQLSVWPATMNQPYMQNFHSRLRMENDLDLDTRCLCGLASGFFELLDIHSVCSTKSIVKVGTAKTTFGLAAIPSRLEDCDEGSLTQSGF